MKCAGQTPGLTVLIFLIACAFQVFAISAASLARGEARARDELSRVIAELRAAQALVAESARMTERLRISRDLHDILGHSLTTLTIQLDVASRLVPGQAGEHVRCAREVAGNLLNEVRSVVSPRESSLLTCVPRWKIWRGVHPGSRCGFFCRKILLRWMPRGPTPSSGACRNR